MEALRQEKDWNVQRMYPSSPTSPPVKRLVWQRNAVSKAKWHRLSEEGEAEAIGVFRAH